MGMVVSLNLVTYKNILRTLSGIDNLTYTANKHVGGNNSGALVSTVK